jgi:hypothetical protein
MHYLNDIWCLYFHDPYDIEWDNSSYKLIATISTVEDFVQYYNAFKPLFYKGMFFLMRTDVMPRWEDELNANGGCFSFKVMYNDLNDKWFSFCANLLGENLGIDENMSQNINGVSISPKKNYYIIRVWIKDKKHTKREYYNLDIPKYSTLMYKNHVEK